MAEQDGLGEEIAAGAATVGAALTKPGRKVLKTVIKGAARGTKIARKALLNRYLALYLVGSAPTKYQPPQTAKAFEHWLRRGEMDLGWYRNLPEPQRRSVYENFRVGGEPRGVKNYVTNWDKMRTRLGMKPVPKKHEAEWKKLDERRHRLFVAFEKKLTTQATDVASATRRVKEQEWAARKAAGPAGPTPEEQIATIEAIAKAAESLAQDPDLFLFQAPAFAPSPDPVVRATLNAVARQMGPGRMLDPEELEVAAKTYRGFERQFYEQSVKTQEFEARSQWITSSQRVSELADSEFEELWRAFTKPDPATGLPSTVLTEDQVEGLKQEAAHRARRRIQQEMETLGPQPAPPVQEEAEVGIRRAVSTVAPVESFGVDLRQAIAGLLEAI